MTPAKTKHFIKRHEELLAKLVGLDHAFCVFFRDARAEYSRAADILDGDDEFIAWCETYLFSEDGTLKRQHAREALALAIAGSVFKNPDELRNAGGLKAVQHLHSYSRPLMIEIMQTAKSEHYSINTVRQRREKASGPPTGDLPKLTPAMDAQALAEFIATKLKKVPPEIAAILKRYVKQESETARA